mgnify:FL=1
MVNFWRKLSPITRSFLIGMVIAGPLTWATIVSLLLLGGLLE